VGLPVQFSAPDPQRQGGGGLTAPNTANRRCRAVQSNRRKSINFNDYRSIRIFRRDSLGQLVEFFITPSWKLPPRNSQNSRDFGSSIQVQYERSGFGVAPRGQPLS
jgi:hypothetical protein